MTGLTIIVLILVIGLVIIPAALAVVRKRGWLYDEKRIDNRLRVAGVTMQADLDPRVNRQRMIDRVQAVKQAHPAVDLILLGETILGWYNKKGETAAYRRSIAESIPGETTTLMARLAEENGLYLSFGMVEACDGKVYNSQVLIDPRGEIVAVHRKVNLQGAAAFQPGDVMATTAEVKGIKVAITICSDIQSAQVRSRLKAERPALILGSLANPGDPHWFVSGLIARLFDAWIVTANRYGAEGDLVFDGQMIVSDPLGDLRVKACDREQFTYYDIGFSADRSPVIRMLRRTYAGMALLVHLFKSLGMFLFARGR